jgi:lysophospholipase L1-like esterase
MERTVLCYGDSNTHGTAPMISLEDRRRLGRDERWTGVLAAGLGAGWHVIEEGLPGRTTVHSDPVEGEWKNGLAVLPAVLESHFPVDLVVLMLGTNDLKPRFQVPPVQIGDSIERLVRVIRHSECGPGEGAPRILLIAPAPVVEEGSLAELFAGGPARSALAGPYAEVARRHDCGFLDAGGIWTVSPVDGVHFDAAEHGKLGRAVAAAVRVALP